MTLTRIFQAGAELNTINEFANYPTTTYGNATAVISSTKARTGTYALRSSSNVQPRGKGFSATTFRAGFFLNHNGAFSGTRQPAICIIPTSLAAPIIVYWDAASGELRLVCNGTTQDTASVSATGFSTTNTWFHIGIFYHGDATTGVISIYLDGVQILSWTGNTGTGALGLYVLGQNSASTGWADYVYVDDLYIDDATGESDAPPSSYRFDWQIANGAGASTNLTPNTGANYAAVDDTTPDDDTTYVYAAASGVKDAYATSNITVPAAHRVTAVIPTAWVRKTDAGTASQWKLGTRSNGGTEVLGSAQSLSTSYGPIWERQTTEPGGADWDESKCNNAQVIIESAGSF